MEQPCVCQGVPTLALRRSLPNMSLRSGTGAFSPSTLSHSSRQSPAPSALFFSQTFSYLSVILQKRIAQHG